MLCDISKLFLRFGRSERGNVLIIVAFAAVIMVSFIGLAIDMSRTNLAKQNQQNSVDIAERAAKNYCLNDTTAKASQPAMQTCITTQVNKYFQANASKNIAGSNVGVNPLITVFDQNTNVPTTTATSQISSAIIQATIDKCAGLTGNALTTCQNSADYQINGSTKSVALATNLVTGASNTAWSGVCGTAVNSCTLGQYEAIPSGNDHNVSSWYCKGSNGGYDATCGATNGACSVATTNNAGSCSSGIVANFVISSDTSQYSTSWVCNGFNGGSSANNCSQEFCHIPNPSTRHTDCETGYIGSGTTETAICDSNGNLVWNTTSSDCTALALCQPSSQSSTAPCPLHYHNTPNTDGGIVTTIPYTCPSQYGQAVAGASIVTNNCTPDPASCVAGTDTVPCGAGFTGNKTRTSSCPDPYGDAVWGNFDVSQCVPIPASCTPKTETRVVNCQTGQYSSGSTPFTDTSNVTTTPGIIQHKDWSCDANNNLTVSKDWYDYDTSGCTDCGTIVENIQMRVSKLGTYSGGRISRNDMLYNQSYRDYLSYYAASGWTNLGWDDNSYLKSCSGQKDTNACLKDTVTTDDFVDAYNIFVKNNGLSSNSIALDKSVKAISCPLTIKIHAFSSPLKVNILGKDAAINSDHSVKFNMTQSNGNKKLYTTYGSLNQDEAWLMIDKKGDGLVKDGIIDGDDFFTDHEGLKNDAYHDLAVTFAPFIKKDEKGHSYISLRKLSSFEKSSDVNIGKKSGTVRAIDPSFDLKLLDVNNNVLYASDYFDRIYVDYINTNISDKDMHNLILAVAPVRTLDGKYHLSVDQWFVPK